MSRAFMPLATLGVLAGVVSLFELGLMSPENAFFLTVAIVVGYTGYLFFRHDGQPLAHAVEAVFARPESHPGRVFGYVAFLAVTVIGLAVAVQSVAVA
jgi:hypothetical protein